MRYNDNDADFYGAESNYDILYSAEFDPDYMFGNDFDIDNPVYMAGWVTAALAALKGAGAGVKAIARGVRRRRGRGGRRRRRRVGRIARKIFRRIKARRARRKAAGKGIFRKIIARRRARGKKGLFAKIRARRRARKARRALKKVPTRSVERRERIRPTKIMADNIAKSFRESYPSTSSPVPQYSPAQKYQYTSNIPGEPVQNVPYTQASIMSSKNIKFAAIVGIGLLAVSMITRPHRQGQN